MSDLSSIKTICLPIEVFDREDFCEIMSFCLPSADIVIGKDKKDGALIPFYGEACLQEVLSGKRTAEDLQMIQLTMDFESQHRVMLATVVIHFKGGCDLPDVQEAYDKLMSSKFVQYLPPDSTSAVSIPERELSSESMQVEVPGTGAVWIDTSQIRPKLPPIQHEILPPEIRSKIDETWQIIKEVWPFSHDQWIEGFRRERKLEREVEIWCHVAKCYRQVTEGQDFDLSLSEKQDIFKVMVLTCSNGAAHVARTVRCDTISPESVRQIAFGVENTWKIRSWEKGGSRGP